MRILEFGTDHFESNIRAPRFIPKDLQIFKTFNIFNMIFDDHIKYSLINIESWWLCLHFELTQIIWVILCLFFYLLDCNFFVVF